MASKNGKFLSGEEREKLKGELGLLNKKQKKKPPPVNQNKRPNANKPGQDNEPCRVCGLDCDHENLLICDKCEGHFHTYCLKPALPAIPRGDWYCPTCKPDLGDGLEELISALPPAITSRFGEICWAQGGSGYGWWPSCIYDPRLTVGVTRSQARRQIGKKFLVYFLQCDETPFDLLPERKILPWDEGLAEDYHLGRAAKAAGKNRFSRFQEAFQAATLEEDKPLDDRLDFGRAKPGQPQILPSPIKIAHRSEGEPGTPKSKKRRASAEPGSGHGQRKRARRTNPFANRRTGHSVNRGAGNSTSRGASSAVHFSASGGSSTAQPVEPENSEDDELYCRIFVTSDPSKPGTNVGFVELESRKSSTFTDARQTIEDMLEPELLPKNWRFLHPKLGPVSSKLEKRPGSMLSYLNKGSKGNAADGTIDRPAIVTLVPVPEPLAK